MDNKRILLVESDLNLCQSIVLILQRAGYMVTAPSCGHDAIETIQAGGYHMLIADIDEAGIREIFLPHVLENFPYLPIVILTDLHGEVRQGNNAFKNIYILGKPVAPEDLLECAGKVFNCGNQVFSQDHHL